MGAMIYQADYFYRKGQLHHYANSDFVLPVLECGIVFLVLVPTLFNEFQNGGTHEDEGMA